ncbi:uncharacterized protein LOC119948721 [Tachyglossus aculeatus]|uniref:uncharacterized protein LOC119948721 n=1 Tax=Tachyglossus aculeatus TaxID=9261 RepID=UPI0018F6549F|nr:uncharacterized protein LOC119948721 [Tachyglossus aculeatus]
MACNPWPPEAPGRDVTPALPPAAVPYDKMAAPCGETTWRPPWMPPALLYLAIPPAEPQKPPELHHFPFRLRKRGRSGRWGGGKGLAGWAPPCCTETGNLGPRGVTHFRFCSLLGCLVGLDSCVLWGGRLVVAELLGRGAGSDYSVSGTAPSSRVDPGEFGHRPHPTRASHRERENRRRPPHFTDRAASGLTSVRPRCCRPPPPTPGAARLPVLRMVHPARDRGSARPPVPLPATAPVPAPRVPPRAPTRGGPFRGRDPGSGGPAGMPRA